MTGGSFSLSEKLLVAGAFVALVAMAVGTEDDPGVVAASASRIAEKTSDARPWSTAASGGAPDFTGDMEDNSAPAQRPSQSRAQPRIREVETLPPGFGGTPSTPPK